MRVTILMFGDRLWRECGEEMSGVVEQHLWYEIRNFCDKKAYITESTPSSLIFGKKHNPIFEFALHCIALHYIARSCLSFQKYKSDTRMHIRAKLMLLW